MTYFFFFFSKVLVCNGILTCPVSCRLLVALLNTSSSKRTELNRARVLAQKLCPILGKWEEMTTQAFVMCAAVGNGSIIVISDDDDEEGEGCNPDLSCYESSLIMEMGDMACKDCTLSPSKMDEEDLVVTFARPAEVLPHARFDCPKHPFEATDDCANPVPGNHLQCEQCFCYICDKLAAKCQSWHVSGVCHCNSHKKSDFWNTMRNSELLGQLAAFKLTLSEVDGHLRQAESMLQSFKAEIRARKVSLLVDKHVDDNVTYDYTPIYECMFAFLNQADQQDGRAAAVMRLTVVQELLQLLEVEGIYLPVLPPSTAAAPKWTLMHRSLSSLQRQMVMDDFTPEFRQKLLDFYRTLSFPHELKHLRTRMDVRPWDDILLVSVFKGQNVVGVRTNKGKKDTLFEDIDVVLLRVDRLLEQKRFRELSRYLRVVRTKQLSRFLELKDLIPLFMCMEGNFIPALTTFFQSGNGLVSRLTLQNFQLYLRVLDTATAPKLSVSPAGELCFASGKWCAIQGAVPLSRLELVRFAYKVHNCCPAIRMNSEFWTHLLKMVHVSRQGTAGIPVPSLTFLEEAAHTIRSLLMEEESGDNLQIPHHFVSVFPDQAMLLLLTGALSHIILHPSLNPIIPLLCTFQKNMWALHWFWKNMVPGVESRVAVVHKIYRELENSTAKDPSRCNLSSRTVLWPPAKNWDMFLQLKDFLPFLLCLEGQTGEALRTFFPERGPAAHLTAHTFQLYLRLLGTSTAPEMTIAPTGELCAHGDTWGCIKGAVPLTRSQLVHFALKVHRHYPAFCANSQCWITLLNVVNAHSLDSIPEPSPDFMHEAVNVTHSMLLSFHTGLISDILIPQHFMLYPDQALLLLITKVLRENILNPDLTPIIPILRTFEKNLWSLHWFWKYLSFDNCSKAIMEKICQELHQIGDSTVSLESIGHLLGPPSSTSKSCSMTTTRGSTDPHCFL
ncbi:uncharacterized protein zgc:112980 isoform X2 [Syngnathoides biaculeatus]|uniref:uncharacterized protein zgc:112980 isoform X2 n=1 Tax=Syngnathoides biaculeatus TaxID=300417 RepID=UPI002ADE1B9F|nr:uncharacterized protein zgc:112980 isoform X2 [Syngnathoides biaculeatus]